MLWRSSNSCPHECNAARTPAPATTAVSCWNPSGTDVNSQLGPCAQSMLSVEVFAGRGRTIAAPVRMFDAGLTTAVVKGAGAFSSKITIGPKDSPVRLCKYVSYQPLPPRTWPCASSWYCRPPFQVIKLELLARPRSILKAGNSAKGPTPSVLWPYLPKVALGTEKFVDDAPRGKVIWKIAAALLEYVRMAVLTNVLPATQLHLTSVKFPSKLVPDRETAGSLRASVRSACECHLPSRYTRPSPPTSHTTAPSRISKEQSLATTVDTDGKFNFGSSVFAAAIAKMLTAANREFNEDMNSLRMVQLQRKESVDSVTMS